MAQRVAVVLALVLSACATNPDTPESADTSSLTSPDPRPQTGTLACNEACTSSTQCGSWCPICGTGTPGASNGRCVHGLPKNTNGAVTENWRELSESTLLTLPPTTNTVCFPTLCQFDWQCNDACDGPAHCNPRKCDNCGGICVALTGEP